MRRRRTLWFAVSFLVVMGLVGQATDRDEMVLTVQVTAAEHEVAEGYFSLGAAATLMVKPGSDLHRFMVRQRGRAIKITLAEQAGRQLSRVDH